MRYFFHISYKGTKYNGWQRHPDVSTVQETIESALSKILKTPIFITGCGRTDAGVHASQYFFHTDIFSEWSFDLPERLNQNLPNDISVFDIFPVEETASARFDAVERTYDYFIHPHKDPFLCDISSLYTLKNLDYDKIKQALNLLPLYTDYRAFCKSPDRVESTRCEIKSANLYIEAMNGRLRFEFTANRFLSRMIRILIRRLLLIGLNKLSVQEFESYLVDNHKQQIIIPAYPEGLYLSDIKYPFLNIPTKSQFFEILIGNSGDWKLV
ncbi:MAG: truA 1 [Daejeonella sp.]|nr:truA 1 [Daejeonella sp.]